MFYSLPLVGVDIQSYDAKLLKTKFEDFIKNFSDKEAVDILASDAFRKAQSDSVSISEIKSAFRDFVSFLEEEELLKEPETIEEMIFSQHEKKYEPHIFWCHINISILILHFFERINYERNRDETPDYGWTPPDNWANGTDDEQEAYQIFWASKLGKGEG